MFNINVNDIFLFPDNVCLSNDDDDATLYSIGENDNTNRNILKKNFYLYKMSFSSNPDRIDLILEDGTKIPSTEKYVVLRVTIDNTLTFYNQFKNLCKKNCKQTKRTEKKLLHI